MTGFDNSSNTGLRFLRIEKQGSHRLRKQTALSEISVKKDCNINCDYWFLLLFDSHHVNILIFFIYPYIFLVTYLLTAFVIFLLIKIMEKPVVFDDRWDLRDPPGNRANPFRILRKLHNEMMGRLISISFRNYGCFEKVHAACRHNQKIKNKK